MRPRATHPARSAASPTTTTTRTPPHPLAAPSVLPGRGVVCVCAAGLQAGLLRRQHVVHHPVRHVHRGRPLAWGDGWGGRVWVTCLSSTSTVVPVWGDQVGRMWPPYVRASGRTPMAASCMYDRRSGVNTTPHAVQPCIVIFVSCSASPLSFPLPHALSPDAASELLLQPPPPPHPAAALTLHGPKDERGEHSRHPVREADRRLGHPEVHTRPQRLRAGAHSGWGGWRAGMSCVRVCGPAARGSSQPSSPLAGLGPTNTCFRCIAPCPCSQRPAPAQFPSPPSSVQIHTRATTHMEGMAPAIPPPSPPPPVAPPLPQPPPPGALAPAPAPPSAGPGAGRAGSASGPPHPP